jgi:hypothetical protein
VAARRGETGRVRIAADLRLADPAAIADIPIY